jgi:hypothetical protein
LLCFDPHLAGSSAALGQRFPRCGEAQFLCGLFGKIRQAYYRVLNHTTQGLLEEEIVVGPVGKISAKSKTSRWGIRKLLQLLSINFTDYYVGALWNNFHCFLNQKWGGKTICPIM